MGRRRRRGIPGPHPGDIDVLVVGDVPRRLLSKIASMAYGHLAIPVSITRLTFEEREDNDSAPFVSVVKSGPTYALDLGGRMAATIE